MRSVFTGLLALALLAMVAQAGLAADPPADKAKLTRQGKYLTASEAYALYAKDNGVIVLDVRTPQEYVFVGHPTMAHNIPIMLWTDRFNAGKRQYDMAENKGFIDAVQAKFNKDQTFAVLCRSGQRSAMAVNKMADAGFEKVYNIIEGFEGEKVADKDDPRFGQRTKDGWKNTGNPWTYDLDPGLVFLSPPD